MTPEQELAKRTRRGFIALGAGAIVVGAAAYALKPDPSSDDIPASLREILELNQKVVRGTIYSEANLVKTYPESAIRFLKKNGDIGIDTQLDEAAWRLKAGGNLLTMDDVRSLPKYSQIIDFKCVEGWSVVTQFAGARLFDFTRKFAPRGAAKKYVSMSTPDKAYYVSVDQDSANHPQTLLAYEMNGKPLTPDHGAPLRLVIPVKYGIKNIKRIDTIEYTDDRPKDYWAEQGYDWYAGL